MEFPCWHVQTWNPILSFRSLLNTLLAGVATTLALATPAQATLLARDLNGDTVTDAFYDTDRDITWLRNANVNGAMTWSAANTWASGFSIGIYDDWRLPTVVQPDSTCSKSISAGTFGIQSYGYNCTASEMGHLWYTELGNAAGSLTNDGDFLNMQSASYWSSTVFALNPTNTAWLFSARDGLLDANGMYYRLYAMAVRSGDVITAQVPEPESMLLALTGLAGLAFVRRRRAVVPSAL